MVDVHTTKQRSYNMSRIRGKDTAPEKTVRSLLRAAGCRFRTNAANLPGKPDVVLPGIKCAIFVHGCFWHRHKECRFATKPNSNADFWERKFSRTVERDREHERALRKLGWTVTVIWECTLKERPEGVRRKISALARRAKARAKSSA